MNKRHPCQLKWCHGDVKLLVFENFEHAPVAQVQIETVEDRENDSVYTFDVHKTHMGRVVCRTSTKQRPMMSGISIWYYFEEEGHDDESDTRPRVWQCRGNAL